MKNTKKLKQILLTSTLLIGMIAIGGTSSQAALQANVTTHTRPKGASGESWITIIRQMEESGQTMGLNEKVDTATCLASTESNNIDVHMMKSTEYGAVAILSASGVGNPKKLQESTIKSTTGNVTGVYIGTKEEIIAGVCFDVGKDARYYDLYTGGQENAKVGDALGTSTTPNKGCTGWHGASYSSNYWFGGNFGSRCGFRRGGTGIFTFIAYSDYSNPYDSSTRTWTGHEFYSRGVAVIGSNL